MEISGRNKEKQRLEALYNSKGAEFLVVYGRRRVGYLIEYNSNTFIAQTTYEKNIYLFTTLCCAADDGTNY